MQILKSKLLFIVFVLFITDLSAVNYNMSTSTPTVTGGDNFFDSNGGAANYGNSESFTLTMVPNTPGQFVSVNFAAFATFNSSDFLQIYDGPSTASPLIGTYYGGSSPGIITARNPSGKLTFRWVSDGANTAAGWSASITLSITKGDGTGSNFLQTNLAVDTVCSGTFYDSGGSGINYLNAEDRTMTFYPGSPGNYVQVAFGSFATFNSSDYLEIYNGTSISDQIIGRYYGSTSPGTITARNATGALTFRFVSDGASGAAGWTATLSCSATKGEGTGTNFVMTDSSVDTICGGTFYDGGGTGNNYLNSETRTMVFYPATSGNYVQAAFTAFTTFNSSDYLEIYNGTSASAPIIGRYYGATSPGTITARNASGALTFVFVSDGANTAAGWAANLSCSAAKGDGTGTNFVMTDLSVDTICGGIFYDSGGSGTTYLNLENRTMTFYPATSGNYIQAAFGSFATFNSSDYLEIYNGTSASAPIIGRYYGSTSPGTVTARNASGALTFVFFSDGANVTTGWTATLSCTASKGDGAGTNFVMTDLSVDTICGGIFYDSGGSGNNYSNLENRTMTFYPATSGNYVQAAFGSFATFNSSDYLEIYNGTSSSAPIIGRYYGSTSPGTVTARNATGALTFVFVADGANTAAGWTATLSCTASKGDGTGTNFVMTNLGVDSICSGIFYDSGGSGNNYLNSENRTMTFYPATLGNYIEASFSAFNTFNSTDYLEIYNGTSALAPIIGRYYGTTSPGIVTARNPAGALTFVFVSDGASTDAGWTAALSCSATKGDGTGTNFVMTNGSVDSLCNGIFYDGGGTGNNYLNSEDRTVVFYPGTPGNYVQAAFSAFTTFDSSDFLEVYNGTSISAPIIGRYYGTTSPGTVTARNASGALTFRFVSDGANTAAGWAAALSCSTTKGDGTGTNFVMTNGSVDSLCSGIFYDSGGSGNNYLNSEDRTVVFYPGTPGNYVQAAFSAFATFNSSDFLEIYNGTSISAPIIGRYYGSTSPGTITARNANGALTFRFVSDGASTAGGWTAALSCSTTKGDGTGSNFVMTNLGVDSICSGIFYDSGGSGNNYSNSENRTMTFYPAIPGNYVEASFSSFATFNASDVLSIFNGTSTAAPLIGNYSGGSSPGTIKRNWSRGRTHISFCI